MPSSHPDLAEADPGVELEPAVAAGLGDGVDPARRTRPPAGRAPGPRRGRSWPRPRPRPRRGARRPARRPRPGPPPWWSPAGPGAGAGRPGGCRRPARSSVRSAGVVGRSVRSPTPPASGTSRSQSAATATDRTTIRATPTTIRACWRPRKAPATQARPTAIRAAGSTARHGTSTPPASSSQPIPTRTSSAPTSTVAVAGPWRSAGRPAAPARRRPGRSAGTGSVVIAAAPPA